MSRKPSDTIPPDGEDHPVRIAKAIARAGLASRRDAEAWITAGRVAVNGETIATPAVTVTARDRVTVDGAPLPQPERTRLFLYYKPVGLVTTNADPEGRPTVFSALPKDLPRLVSVGRLDIATEGLLLLTNDGGLARVLELPATGWVRRYRVRAHGRVDQAALDRLRDGITIDGIHYGPIEATLDRDLGTNVWLTIAIREGKNREVRNVVEALGLQVNRLIRVSFGPFQLGDLSDGEVSEVKTRVLRDQLGERVIAQAGCDFSAPVVEREAEAHKGSRPPRAERATEDRPVERVARDRRPERSPRDQRAERPARREDGPRRRGDAGDRPAGLRQRNESTQSPRPRRSSRDDALPPRNRQSARLRRLRPDERDLADAPAGRPRRGNAWRSDDAPLGRHYRGAGTKARRLPDEAARPKRAGLIADRKGRRVLVERVGEKPTGSSASPLEGEAGAKRGEGGKLGSPSRKRTPLPTPPPQGGRERFRDDQRPRGKPFRQREPSAADDRPRGKRFGSESGFRREHSRSDERPRGKPFRPREPSAADERPRGKRFGSESGFRREHSRADERPRGKPFRPDAGGSDQRSRKPYRRGNETDQRGGKAERWEDKAPRRASSRAPPHDRGDGATRAERGKSGTAFRSDKGPQRSRSSQPRDGAPRPRPSRDAGKPHSPRSSRPGNPHGPRPPRGGPKPSRPGPKKRR